MARAPASQGDKSSGGPLDLFKAKYELTTSDDKPTAVQSESVRVIDKRNKLIARLEQQLEIFGGKEIKSTGAKGRTRTVRPDWYTAKTGGVKFELRYGIGIHLAIDGTPITIKIAKADDVPGLLKSVIEDTKAGLFDTALLQIKAGGRKKAS